MANTGPSNLVMLQIRMVVIAESNKIARQFFVRGGGKGTRLIREIKSLKG